MKPKLTSDESEKTRKSLKYPSKLEVVLPRYSVSLDMCKSDRFIGKVVCQYPEGDIKADICTDLKDTMRRVQVEAI